VSGEHKEKISFSTQIVDRVEKSTGLRITKVQACAGALILKHGPGQAREAGTIERGD
jgi:hypothetical protein